jgi:hypothetical protein
MRPDLFPFRIYLLSSIIKIIQQWLRPDPTLIGATALADLTYNRTALIVEYAMLRQ